jgi:hypothetical protein
LIPLNGNYSLTGGFWSLIAVAQTTGVPTLYPEPDVVLRDMATG